MGGDLRLAVGAPADALATVLEPGHRWLLTSPTNPAFRRVAVLTDEHLAVATLSIDAGGAVRVGAESSDTLTAKAVGVAVSAALTNPENGVSVSLSGAGAEARNTTGSRVTAVADGGVIDGASVAATAADAATTTATITAVSAAVGVVAAAVGVSLGENAIGTAVDAATRNGDILAGAGGVAVEGRSAATAAATLTPAAVSVGLGISGTVAVANSTIDGSTEARADGFVRTTGPARVAAFGTDRATTDTRGGSGGVVSFDGMFATSAIGRDTRAAVGGDAEVHAGSLTVATYGPTAADPQRTRRTASASTTVGQVAAVGGSGGRASAAINGDVEAAVRDGAVIDLASGGDLLVDAKSSATAAANAPGGGGGGLAVSALFADAAVGGTTTAFVGDAVQVSAGGVTVRADGSNA
ncbi:MAG: hypothetical protein K2X87_07670, partial [Gemmataceae bacterium]|nr:hypothetical protein [Gemmataceae bacterium]